MKRLAIIIPAFNESSVIAESLMNLQKHVDKIQIDYDLIVIDDGSTDDTGKAALKHCNFLLTHKKNSGLGAALATGIEFAKRKDYDYLLTFDSDGQHDPKDIKKAINKLNAGYDVIIGSRFLGKHTNMPRGRKMVLTLSNLITYIFFGIWSSDSQSGFRALSKKTINSIELKANRMEVSSEFIGQIRKKNLSYTEIPIHIRYSDYSIHKGQKNSHGINVLIKLVYSLFR